MSEAFERPWKVGVRSLDGFNVEILGGPNFRDIPCRASSVANAELIVRAVNGLALPSDKEADEAIENVARMTEEDVAKIAESYLPHVAAQPDETLAMTLDEFAGSFDDVGKKDPKYALLAAVLREAAKRLRKGKVA